MRGRKREQRLGQLLAQNKSSFICVIVFLHVCYAISPFQINFEMSFFYLFPI